MRAPIWAAHAMRTPVLRPIIVIYSSIGTLSRCSKSMSICWPSHTSEAVFEKSLRASGSTAAGAWAMRLYASMHITSPLRMAVSSFHFFHTVSCPRRRGLRSIMSSWMRVKVWKTSRPAAGSRMCGPSSSAKIPYVVRHRRGLMRFPPISIIYRRGSYSPAGSFWNWMLLKRLFKASEMVLSGIIVPNFP